ncbi:hypothetical protein FHX35_002441 [Auritidibacter ignavus]|nr:hypothetical protein [Auritidibacter ignavus]
MLPATALEVAWDHSSGSMKYATDRVTGFGIVTALQLQLFPVDQILAGALSFAP